VWFYLVATFILFDQGQKAQIRAVGPFQTAIICEMARASDDNHVWIAEKCFEEFEDVKEQAPQLPPWMGYPFS
jgi:hypothetical protein